MNTAGTLSGEQELLLRARSGDRVACEELFVNYIQGSRSIAGLLYRALSDPEDRQEMLHEIYVQVISGCRGFRGDSSLNTYLYQIARRTVLQHYRRQNTLKRGKLCRTIYSRDEVAGSSELNPEYMYVEQENRRMILREIDRLPASVRDALWFRIVDELSYEEIARKMKMPVNTVSTKIHKGKKLLAFHLGS